LIWLAWWCLLRTGWQRLGSGGSLTGRRVPSRVPRNVPDGEFNEIFAALALAPRPGAGRVLCVDRGAGGRADLGDPFILRSIYQVVLRETIRAEELTADLNRDMLPAVWHDLYLPKRVRRAWEERHPALRAATAPAA